MRAKRKSVLGLVGVAGIAVTLLTAILPSTAATGDWRTETSLKIDDAALVGGAVDTSWERGELPSQFRVVVTARGANVDGYGRLELRCRTRGGAGEEPTEAPAEEEEARQVRAWVGTSESFLFDDAGRVVRSLRVPAGVRYCYARASLDNNVLARGTFTLRIQSR
jgi:hypothetical protein